MPTTRVPSLGPHGEGWTVAQLALMASIATAAVGSSSAPAADSGTGSARAAGAVALLIGIVLIGVGSWLLRRRQAFSILPRPPESGVLVEAGPYRVIRHPIYLGLVLAGAGGTLYSGSVVVGVLTLALGVVLDLKRRREEAWLVERFPEYVDYRQRTKALIPLVY